MYNFAKQKEMNEMLEDFEHYCEKVEEIKLYTTESKIDKYDCQYELGIILYYLQGEAVAYIDDEDALNILKQGIEFRKTLDIVEEITRELGEKIYLVFESNAEYFASEINKEMYRKRDYIKEEEEDIGYEEECLDDWKLEEERIEKTMQQEKI